MFISKALYLNECVLNKLINFHLLSDLNQFLFFPQCRIKFSMKREIFLSLSDYDINKKHEIK